MSKKDVCVVNSPLFREISDLYDEDSLPPLGLGYIATAARAKGLSVELLDAVAERIPLATLIDRVSQLAPGVVAINIFTTNYELVRDFCESISSHFTKIIIGGLSTRTLHERIFTWRCQGKVDVVFGDGEHIFPDLVIGCEREAPVLSIGKFRYFKVDDKSIYYSEAISGLALDRSFFAGEPVFHPRGYVEANIVAGRGCIYNCAFCAAARSLNKDMSVRERSVECIVNEISRIVDADSRVNSIRVLDDLFLKGSDSIRRAVEVFGRFPLSWRAMAHVMTFSGVTQDQIKELSVSGCRELFVGVESGSPRILKSIHKTHDIGKIENNLGKVMAERISLKAYFIYGFPGEDVGDFEMTYRLAERLKGEADRHGVGFRTSVFQFRPYHGTELYHTLKARGVETNDVLEMKGDSELSNLVGRIQFNFHSGNYSNAPLAAVREYIHRTASLSSVSDWGLS